MKYVALLRGINVGGHNKVEMKKLKQTFEQLGFEQVVTYINSGNVIFETATTERLISELIEKAILDDFDLPIRVVIRSQENINQLIQIIPLEWENNSEFKTDILFLWPEVDSPEVLQEIYQTKVDEVRYFAGTVLWSLKKENYNQSGMNRFVGTRIYKHMTARNVNTVRKLHRLMNVTSS